ncbi:MAG: hypothetical protein JWQ09_2814 [Segetibacter sp.]|nr:hypothetical protein [Segetibacter sp.]
MYDNELYSAYFKKDSEYYLNRLERYKNGDKYVMNGYAFFFGIFWFMYRKMYFEALIICMIIIAEGILEDQITANLDAGTNKIIGTITNIAVAVVISLFANSLYINKAERTINNAMLVEPDQEKLIGYLQKKGGVSYWFLIIAFGAIAAIIWYFYQLNNSD